MQLSTQPCSIWLDANWLSRPPAEARESHIDGAQKELNSEKVSTGSAIGAGDEQLLESMRSACSAHTTSQLVAHRIARPIARLFEAYLMRAGLSESQYLLLAQLRSGPLRAIDLARTMGLNPSTLSRSLGQLVHDGLVEIAPSRDARSYPVQLTALGVQQYNEAHLQCEAAEQEVRAILGDDQIAALHILAEDIHRLLLRSSVAKR